MILALHVMQPPADTEERLVRREVVLGFSNIDKSDGLQEFYAVGFAFQVSVVEEEE
jgi:hypothetical protein